MTENFSTLQLKYLGIDAYKEPIIYMRSDCYICKSEGFETPARLRVKLNDRTLIATLNTVNTNLLRHNEASLSSYAWKLLSAKEGDEISVEHPKPLESLSYIRSKIYGHELKSHEMRKIIDDVLSGQLSDIHIAMFLAVSAGDKFTKKEIFDLTKAMIDTGQRLAWPADKMIVNIHSVGGVPANRTTPIVVSIVAEFGMIIPKTSSRAITSPSGTADTMEVFTPVDLDIPTMQNVVEHENGCVVWGGSATLSPADDLFIRIESTADLDSEGQMIASILSKNIAAGATHMVIEIPIGTTAKVRSIEQAQNLKQMLESTAKEFSVTIKIIFTDGSQPIGRGIGPALEARDILAVLKCDENAPQDLRERSLMLAGHVLEFSKNVKPGQGKKIATEILDSGKAFEKFQRICKAQGRLHEIPTALFTHMVESKKSGEIVNIDNRKFARIAKLAGAPQSKVSGVELFTPLKTIVKIGQPLFKIHAETPGELAYALRFLEQGNQVFQIE